MKFSSRFTSGRKPKLSQEMSSTTPESSTSTSLTNRLRCTPFKRGDAEFLVSPGDGASLDMSSPGDSMLQNASPVTSLGAVVPPTSLALVAKSTVVPPVDLPSSVTDCCPSLPACTVSGVSMRISGSGVKDERHAVEGGSGKRRRAGAKQVNSVWATLVKV